EETEEAPEPEPEAKGIGALHVPDRHIYCLDLRDFSSHQVYIDEVRRIAAECRQRREEKARQGNGTTTMMQLGIAGQDAGTEATAFTPEQLMQAPGQRRWYPVIDYSRCTNCLECLDFCLFGVYGVDSFERILVENQDHCKKGCPACSRVCPEHAIIFPDY